MGDRTKVNVGDVQEQAPPSPWRYYGRYADIKRAIEDMPKLGVWYLIPVYVDGPDRDDIARVQAAIYQSYDGWDFKVNTRAIWDSEERYWKLYIRKHEPDE
jgi:hypothetical protein